MDSSWWVQLVGAIGAAVASPALLGGLTKRVSRDERLRRSIERDIELLDAIDWDSDAKTVLRESVERRLVRLASIHDEKRDPVGLGIAGALLLLGILAAWASIASESWWRYAGFVFSGMSLMFGLVGLATELPRKAPSPPADEVPAEEPAPSAVSAGESSSKTE